MAVIRRYTALSSLTSPAWRTTERRVDLCAARGEEEGGGGEEVGEVWAAEVEGGEGVVGEVREKLEEVEVVLRWRGREGVR